MKKGKILLYVIFFIYIIILIDVLFYSRRFAFSSSLFSLEHFSMCNLIPFKTINNYIKAFLLESVDINIIVSNLLGNILLFIPMGFMLPFISSYFNKFSRVLIFVFFSSLFAEVIQFITFTGSTDIDDIILNVIGGVIGYFFAKTFI